MRLQKALQLSLTAIIISAFIVPSLVAADDSSTSTALPPAQTTTSTPKTKKTICISDFVAKTNQKLANQETKIAAARAKRDDTLATNRANQEAKTATNQANWDATRAASFTKLYGKANTPARTQVLTDFNAAQTAAIAVRRSAVDVANQAFKTGVDQIIAQRRGAVDVATTTYMGVISNVIATAQADCAAGITPKTVKAQFNQMLKNAKSQFTANKKTTDSYQTQVQPLATTHKAAIAQAQKDFNATIAAIKNTFKTAWKAGAPTKATTTPAQ